MITVPGSPVPKGRPRMSRGHAYTPQRTRDYENLIKQCYLSANGRTKLTGPIICEIRAYFQIPKSKPVKIKREMAAGKIKHTKRPDIDNIIKTIDALNGLAFDDDSQIVEIKAGKYYSSNPRMEIFLEEATK